MKRILCLIFCVLFAFLVSGCTAIKNNAVLKIGVSVSCPPYAFFQDSDKNGAVKTKDGKEFINGYNIQYGKMLAKKLGLYNTEFYLLERNELEDAVIKNKVDCVIAQQSYGEIANPHILKSEPYYYTSVAVLTKRKAKYSTLYSFDDLKDAQAVCMNFSRWKSSKKIKQIDFKYTVSSFEEMVSFVAEEKCDIAVCDITTAQCAVIFDRRVKYRSFFYYENDFPKERDEIRLCITASDKNEELINKINEVISTVSIDDRDKMMDDTIIYYKETIKNTVA